MSPNIQDRKSSRKDRNIKQLKLSEFDIELEKEHILKCMLLLDVRNPATAKPMIMYQGIYRYLDCQKVSLELKYKGRL